MLWEHSFGSAVAARINAAHSRKVSADEAFLAGLFHDIGKIIMNIREKEKFRLVIERCFNEMLPFEEIEQTVFHTPMPSWEVLCGKSGICRRR